MVGAEEAAPTMILMLPLITQMSARHLDFEHDGAKLLIFVEFWDI